MTSDTDNQTAQTPAQKTDTEYVVLRLDYFGDGSTEREMNAWTEVGRRTAQKPAVAIKDFIGNGPVDDPGEGLYVAVPARSWKPVKVTPQVVTNLLLEETN